MDNIRPLKRSPYLKSISRDHHYGLLLCWKIRTGFNRNVEIGRIKQYVDWFWQSHLATHFDIEEQHIFPILGKENDLVKKALAEHRRLKRLFIQEDEIWRSLNLIEDELDSHIRFEERILFNKVQQIATVVQLVSIAEHHNNAASCDEWEDEFWK